MSAGDNVNMSFTFIDFASFYVTRVRQFAQTVNNNFFRQPIAPGPQQTSYDTLVAANTALVLCILHQRRDLGFHIVSWILGNNASHWTGNVLNTNKFPWVLISSPGCKMPCTPAAFVASKADSKIKWL